MFYILRLCQLSILTFSVAAGSFDDKYTYKVGQLTSGTYSLDIDALVPVSSNS